MSVITHALAVGLGYMLGRPDGRRQLGELQGKAAELARRPEVRRLRERGWDLAGDRALAVKRRMRPNPARGGDQTGTGGNADDTAVTTTSSGAGSDAGFDGRTALDDTQAVVTGMPVPPRASHPAPPVPPGEER